MTPLGRPQLLLRRSVLQGPVELPAGAGNVLDEAWQFTASAGLSVRNETGRVLLHLAVQRGLLGAVALVANRSAIAMRPAGLVRVGLHAMDMGSLGWASFSGRAGQRIRLWWGSTAPSATATALQRRSTIPGSATAGHAVAVTARWRPRQVLPNHPGQRPAQNHRPTKKTESTYPRPRDRRLTRKTRAAVGKPPDATAASPAVRSADSTGANPPSIRQREDTSTDACAGGASAGGVGSAGAKSSIG